MGVTYIAGLYMRLVRRITRSNGRKKAMRSTTCLSLISKWRRATRARAPTSVAGRVADTLWNSSGSPVWEARQGSMWGPQ